MTFLDDITNVFFPRSCAGCSRLLTDSELYICTECLFLLPRTNYWTEKENQVAKIFWGRVYLENAASYLLFNKGSRLQHIIHHLKYKNQKEIGEFLGRLFAQELIHTDFSKVDIIIPVPLHPKKLKKRGYNQSEHIANGIASIFKKKVVINSLIRSSLNKSQTLKSRFERWENVRDVFKVVDTELLLNKHVLLVDDVLTTGATIEACATAILEVEGTKVSVVTLANTVK